MNGETKAVQHQLKEPFRFNGVECRTNLEVWEVLAGKWENAKELLFTGVLGEFYGEQDYGISSEIRWIVSNYRNPKKTEEYTPALKDKIQLNDVGLCRFLLSLSGGETLVWRGKKYASLADISQEIEVYFNAADVMETTPDLTALLSTEVLGYWNEIRPRENTPSEPQAESSVRETEGVAEDSTGLEKNEPEKKVKRPETPELIQNIRRLAGSESEWIRLIAYATAYYGFMENPDQVSYRKCRDLDQLCLHLDDLGQEFYGEVAKILVSPYFYGFLFATGYGESAEELIGKIRDGKCHEDLELLFDYLEENTVTDRAKDKLVDCYLKKGPWAHLYWWKNHMGLYQFHNNEAGILRARIEGMKFDDSSLEKVREKMVELENYSIQFRGLFADNLFLVGMGLDGGKTSITSPHMEAYWHYEFYGKKAPIGFCTEIEKGGDR